MFSSQIWPTRLYRRILPIILLIIVGLSPLPPAISTAQTTVLVASLPPGLTYTAEGQIYSVNLESGATIAQDAAPPKGSVVGPGNTLIWIEAGLPPSSNNEISVQTFQIVRANIDGSNREILLSSDPFYAAYSEYSYAPNRLTVGQDAKRIFFDPCILITFYDRSCGTFAIDLETKDITNLNFDGSDSVNISPDGARSIGTFQKYCPEGSINYYFYNTYLFRSNNSRVTLGTGIPGDAVWPSNGQLVFSMSNAFTCDNIAETDRIRLADPNGNKIRDLVLNVQVDNLVLSPDQQQLAYITVQREHDFAPALSKQLWLVNLDGTGNRKIADLPKDAGELRWLPACAIPPAPELINEVDQLATKSNVYIDQVLATGRQAAIDGDYFAAQEKADEIKLIADGITDSIGVLGEGFSTVNKVKDGLKVSMPGVAGRGWNHIIQLKGNSGAARKAFEETLKQPVTAASARIAGKALLSDAYKYYASDMADQAAEELLTNRAIQDNFLTALQGELALQSRMYPGLEKLSNDFKQDITKTATNAPVVFPCMDTAQQALYVTDLKKRGAANVVMYTTLDQRAAPLRNAHIAREAAEDKWLHMFLAKFFLKATATIAFDGPGALAVEGLSAGWNLYQNTQRLKEDTKMMHIGVNTLGGALDVQKAMYLNTVHGIDNMTFGVPPQIPSGQVNSITNKSISDLVVFGQSIWWERKSYSEISLTNTSDIATLYQIIGVYGNTGLQGHTYQTLVTEHAVNIPAQSTRVIQLPYKGEQGSDGVSPDKDSTITINILGSTDTGVYWVLNTSTTWQPEYSTGGGIASVKPQATIQDTAIVLPYPIRSRINANTDTMTYEPRLWVDNPFDYPIHVSVTQPLPSEIQVLDAYSGTVTGNSIAWSQDIAPKTTIELTHTILYTGTANTVVTYPSAQLIMTNEASANTASFTSDPALFQSLTPLIAEGLPVAHLLMNQQTTIPFSITNRSSSNATGIIHLTLTDLNGAQVYSKAQDITVPANGGYDLALPLQAPGSTGTYILTATVDSNGGSAEIFALYLEVAQPMMYLPLVQR